MEIKINDLAVTLEGDRLINLFSERHIEQQQGIAIAVNQSVIPKKDWAEHKLKTNDSVLVIKPIQGG